VGLDIAFNREAAIKAGLILHKVINGTDLEIASAKVRNDSQDYIDYLQQEVELVHVPGTNMHTYNGGIDDIVIRANQWGSVYGPMTTWLQANNITWTEF
jgi:hypothetical protein